MTPLRFGIEGGSRVACRDNINIAREGQGDSVAYVRWLLELIEKGVASGSVAHLGGGFCVMPRLMGPNFSHTVYEIEPELMQFVPAFARGVLGDWRETMSGVFDIIVSDTGEPDDGAEKFLKPGGVLLR